MERLSPKPELLVGKSIEVAKRAELSARKLLDRHSDLIGPGIIDIIVQRESSLALQEYGKQRLEGRANDNSSHTPDITVYVKTEAKDRVLMACIGAGYSVPKEQIQIVTERMWALRFPRGVYFMRGGCQFYQEASENYEKSSEADKPFSLGYDEVIRVEGDFVIEGDPIDLWQNVNYNWDGTPKTK